MYVTRLYALIGLLLIVAGVSGCTDGGAAAFRQDDPNDIPQLIAEAAAIQQPTVDDITSDRTPSALVSTASTHQAVQPSLITLPKGGDLNSQINGASGPVLLDFFADWCGPCRVQGKILHALEDTAAENRTLIIKINVDEHPQIAEELQVSSLPTLIMIKDGKIVRRQSGVAQKSRLVAWMQ